MRIDHIAIWVADLERMREFYVNYFNAVSNEKYSNPSKGFTSYFLNFGEDKTRIELMNRQDINDKPEKRGFTEGMAHFAISVGSKEAVHELTERLRTGHYTIESEPRTTGDGYYESVILDPEGNQIEICV